MPNGLFIPQFRGPGSPGAPGVGTTVAGIQRGELGQQAIERGGLELFGQREQARLQSIVQGAQQLKLIIDPQQKMSFLQNRRQQLQQAGISTEDTDEAISLLQAGDFVGLEEATDQAISLGQAPGEPFTLRPGEARFTAAGREIARGIKDPKQAEAQLKRDVAASKTKFDRASKIRAEITKASTEFDKIIGSFDRIQVTAVGEPSAAGDIALIFNFMKMLDPGSVVREGEFATAQNAAGVPDRVRNTLNRLMRGERLNPTQRKDFLNQSKKIFTVSKKRNDQTLESFVKIAERNDIAREDVVVPRGEELPEIGALPPTAEVADQELPEETIIVNSQTGQRMQVVNGQLVEIQ